MFVLNPVLAADTVDIATWDLSLLRLMKDSNYPWLILVPARPDVSAMHQLNSADAAILMVEIRRASELLQDLYSPRQINVAALSNVVSQLHVHVIARFETDAAWPGPVWGAVPRQDYGERQLQAAIDSLRRHCIGTEPYIKDRDVR